MDISGVVIEEMRSKFSHCEGMKWDVQDVLDMTYDDSSFDVVVDKSLMDCIFHCGNSEPLVANMLGELHRVLRKGSGVAVFLTTQQPEIVRGAQLVLLRWWMRVLRCRRWLPRPGGVVQAGAGLAGQALRA